MINFEQRSYSGKLFRPRPEVHLEEDGSLLIIATPWGPRSCAEKAVNIVRDLFYSIREDGEATSPFERLSCLSFLGNNMRLALRFANDQIHKEDNLDEYMAGFEILALARNEDEVVWAQVGQPALFLDRRGETLIPLEIPADLSLELNNSSHRLPPLPGRLLGLASTSNFAVHSFKPQTQDRFVIASRTYFPAPFYAPIQQARTLRHLSNTLANDNADEPFWLSIFNP